MECHDRLGETEAKARTRLRTALLQPHEALRRPGAIGVVWNALAIVRDGKLDLAVRAFELYTDRRLGRRIGRVLDRIVDDVGERLADQLAVAADDKNPIHVAVQRNASLLGHRLIEFDDITYGRRQIDAVGVLGRIARLQPGDHQDGVEGLYQLVGL